MISIPPDAFISVQIPPSQVKGYVDLNNLKQCLDWFWQGTLDHVDLGRIWMRSEELVPGNPLAGLLDSDSIRRCLYRLPEQLRSAIAFYYEPEEPELIVTLGHYYVWANDPGFDFVDFCRELYQEALLALSDLVQAEL